MTEVPAEDLRQPIWFQFRGRKDSRDDIEENVNSLSGKTFLTELRNALLSGGWSESMERYDSKVFAEDWGWCVFLRYHGALMMLGAHVLWEELSEKEAYSRYLDEDWIECGISAEHFHKRTLGDRLRGRNKADPQVLRGAFASIWDTLYGLDDIRGLSRKHPGDR